MRSNDTFNIITGEIKRQYPTSTHNKRFASLDVVRKMQESFKHPQEKTLPTTNTRPLGTPKDHQLYQYSYLPRNNTADNTQALTRKLRSTQNQHKTNDYLEIGSSKRFLWLTRARQGSISSVMGQTSWAKRMYVDS